MSKRPTLSQDPGCSHAAGSTQDQNDRIPSRNESDALARLANDIAHDFNNLITSILGNAEALKARFDGDQAGAKELATIRGEAERAAGILRRLTAVGDRSLLSEPLPCAPPPCRPAKQDEDQASRGQAACAGKPRLRVLLAEDDNAVRRVVSLTLKRAGYDVTPCATGEEAWQAFQGNPQGFDLLITDLSMPVLDGASLIQRVRLLHPRLRTLLISGYCDDRQAFDLVRSGAVGFLPKPFNSREFLSFVKGHLEAA